LLISSFPNFVLFLYFFVLLPSNHSLISTIYSSRRRCKIINRLSRMSALRPAVSTAAPSFPIRGRVMEPSPSRMSYSQPGPSLETMHASTGDTFGNREQHREDSIMRMSPVRRTRTLVTSPDLEQLSSGTGEIVILISRDCR